MMRIFSYFDVMNQIGTESPNDISGAFVSDFDVKKTTSSFEMKESAPSVLLAEVGFSRPHSSYRVSRVPIEKPTFKTPLADKLYDLLVQGNEKALHELENMIYKSKVDSKSVRRWESAIVELEWNEFRVAELLIAIGDFNAYLFRSITKRNSKYRTLLARLAANIEIDPICRYSIARNGKSLDEVLPRFRFYVLAAMAKLLDEKQYKTSQEWAVVDKGVVENYLNRNTIEEHITGARFDSFMVMANSVNVSSKPLVLEMEIAVYFYMSCGMSPCTESR